MTGALFYSPRMRAVSHAIQPLPGALLHFFRAGTEDRVPVYKTSAGSGGAQHTNPVRADGYGEFPAIYLEGGDFQVVLTLASGAEVWREDRVPAPGTGGGGGGGTGGGEAGPAGLSVAELSIFYRGDIAPPTPFGGSFNFLTQTLSPPDGWTVEIPDDNPPAWTSRAVAAVEGTSGTDANLAWSTPVRVFADGSSVDIVFTRAPTQPPQPAPSPDVPLGWYTDVASVPPAPGQPLWSSVGTRDHASQNWIWQLPIQVEGNAGATGEAATLYYIKPTQGTAIKNGTGTLRVEAHKVFGGNDILLTTGNVQLYVGSTLVTAGNGFGAGSNGYVGVFDSGDIAGSVTVALKDAPAGNTYDTISLVDVADGEADTGKNAVYGYVEASNGLSFTRGIDQTTWFPSANTTRLDATFVQGGVEVARVAWLVTRASNGSLTGAVATHGAGDLNGSRVTVTESNEGSPAFTVKFAYSNAGDATTVSETVITSLSGANGAPGTIGDPGPAGSGLSVAELAIYKRATSPPATPTGGSYDFGTLILTPPAGWTSEIPTGSAPVYASRGVASVTGTTGVDAVISWSTPVKSFSDGASVDIVFKRNAAQPATPAPSSGVPPGWYSDVASVPVSSDLLWSTVGTREYNSDPWVWNVPVQVEGEDGAAGAPGVSATLYYIKPLDGTAIKNGLGTLRIEAHRILAGVDAVLGAGPIQLYEGSTAKGYTASFNSASITGSVVIEMKDGPTGTVYDSIALVDIADGTPGGPGTNAVYGYVEADGPLAWVRDVDQATWTPSSTTMDLDCTFVQGGVDVARVARRISMAADGKLTAAATTHAGGDLNGSRVTVTVLGSGTQVLTVKFAYSYVGDTAVVTETALTSITPATGPPGPGAIQLQLSRVQYNLPAYQNGQLVTPFNATGLARVFEGATEVTGSATFSVTTTNCTVTINTATDVPEVGQPRGFYRLSALAADTGTFTITAVYGGLTLKESGAASKLYVGFEIVSALPTTNLFAGRIVFLTTDSKLYRYNGSNWTVEVDGADIRANSVTANQIRTGTLTSALINTTEFSTVGLSAITGNVGVLTAGVVQSSPTNPVTKFDLTQARIIYNSAPGATGGMVRVQGGGFGPGGQYLDWYGAKPPGTISDAQIVAALTDAGANYFLKVDGSQYNKRTRGEFEPKAWVVFSGNPTVSVQDRYNVNTVTRSAQGVYVVTFAAQLANVNYVVTGTAERFGADVSILVPGTRTKANVTIETRKGGDGSKRDCDYVGLIIFGSNVENQSNVTVPTGGYGGGAWGGGNHP